MVKLMERPVDVLGTALELMEHEKNVCRVLQMVCIRWSYILLFSSRTLAWIGLKKDKKGY